MGDNSIKHLIRDANNDKTNFKKIIVSQIIQKELLTSKLLKIFQTTQQTQKHRKTR